MASISTKRACFSHIHAQLPLPYLPLTPFLQQPRYRQPLNLRSVYSKPKNPRKKPGLNSTLKESEDRSNYQVSSTLKPEDANPPASTRPAELGHTPTRAEAGNLAKWAFANGRAYYTFYKTGIKNVYHNYRASLAIRRSLGIPSSLPTTPRYAHFFKPGEMEPRTNRANMQLIRRAAYDVRRLIPFGLILIVFGELTPLLIALLGTAVTPYTCRTPSQLEKDRVKRAQRRNAAMQFFTRLHEPDSDFELDRLITMTHPTFLRNAPRDDVLHACVVFGLTKSAKKPEFLVDLLYRKKLSRHAAYLFLDDQLIRDAGGVKAMDAAEVRIAVDERGGAGLPRGSEKWEAERIERKWLEMWLQGPRIGPVRLNAIEGELDDLKKKIVDAKNSTGAAKGR